MTNVANSGPIHSRILKVWCSFFRPPSLPTTSRNWGIVLAWRLVYFDPLVTAIRRQGDFHTLYSSSILRATLFSRFPTEEKLRSLSSTKRGSESVKWYFFLASFRKLGAEGIAEVDVAPGLDIIASEGGDSSDAGSSTCAIERSSHYVKPCEIWRPTAFDPNQLVYKTFIGQLCKKWCYHVHLSIKDD